MKYLQQILMTTFLLFLIPLLSQSQVQSSQVFFDVAKHELTSSAQEVLDKLYVEVLKKGYSEVQVAGFTDADGTNAYNQNLSKRRTDAVVKYLITKGMKRSQFVNNWYGETKSDGVTATDDVKQLNRRVDIRVKNYAFNTFDQVLKELQGNRTQKFVLDRDGAHEITCERGTVFKIASRAFKDEKGNSVRNKDVVLMVQEFPSMEDAFLFNLSTQTENGILESGGMLKVDLFKNGQKLSPNGPNTMVVEMPSQNRKLDMNVFVADDLADQDAVGWQNTSQSFDLVNKKIPLALVKMNSNILENTSFQVKDHSINSDYTLEFKIPFKATKPRMPKSPKKPILTNAQKEFGFWMTLFTTKAYRQKKVDEINAGKNEEYQDKYEAYLGKNERYKVALRQYEEGIDEFEKELKNYKEHLYSYVEQIGKDQERVRAQFDQERCNYAIGAMRRENKKGFNTSFIVEMFHSFAGRTIMNQYAKKLMSLNRKRGEMRTMLDLLENDQYKEYAGKNIYFVAQKKVDKEIKRRGKWIYGWQNSRTLNLEARRLLNRKPNLRKEMRKAEKEFNRVNRITQDKIVESPSSVYRAGLSNVGYINCDRFVSIPPSQMVSLNLGPKGRSRTTVYLKKYNSMLYPKVNKNNELVVRVPRSTSLKIVRLEMKEGKPYFAVKPVTVNKSQNVIVKTQMASLEQIQNGLENL